MNYRHMKNVSLTLAFCMLLSTAACSRRNKDKTEETSSIQSSSSGSLAEDSTGDTVVSDTSDTSAAASDTTTSTDPRWGGGPMNRPQTFDFDLSYSDDLLVIDYGKSTVNVYRAKYGEGVKDFHDNTWTFSSSYDVLQWTKGSLNKTTSPFWEADMWSVPNRAKSVNNIHNVKAVSLKDLDGGEDIAARLDVPPETKVLCWTYELNGFPWEYFNGSDWITVDKDIETVKYVQMGSQYVDGLPLTGSRTFCSGNDTFEWEGVIGPSRLTNNLFEYSPEAVYSMINGDCAYCFPTNTYTITDTVLSDQEIVDPKDCLDAIKEALIYDPAFSSRTPSADNPFLVHVWETEVEVYMMELSYVVLDPEPYEENDPNLSSHELTLVPVWEVYFTVMDPHDTRLLQNRKIMINAVTGESLYSKTYGPDENEVLYPKTDG